MASGQIAMVKKVKINGKNLGSNYCSRQPFLTHVSGCAAITISTDTSDASQGKHMVPAHANITCISVQNTREYAFDGNRKACSVGVLGMEMCRPSVVGVFSSLVCQNFDHYFLAKGVTFCSSVIRFSFKKLLSRHNLRASSSGFNQRQKGIQAERKRAAETSDRLYLLSNALCG